MENNYTEIEQLAIDIGKLKENVRIMRAVQDVVMPLEVREALYNILNEK